MNNNMENTLMSLLIETIEGLSDAILKMREDLKKIDKRLKNLEKEGL